MTVREIELRRQMDHLAREAQEIPIAAATAGRAMTAEERAKFKRMIDEVLSTKRSAETAAAEDDTIHAELLASGATRGEHYKMVDRYIRGKLRLGEALELERRDFGISTDNIGGIAVPVDVYPLMEVAMKPWQAMPNAAQTIITAGGAPLKMGAINDSTVYAEIAGEAQSGGGSNLLSGVNSANVDVSTPFGGVTLGGFLYDTKVIGISFQLFEDAAIDIQAMLIAAMGERFGRAFNRDCTVGVGASTPMGLITALVAANTKMIDTANGVAIAASELQSFPFNIYAPYRMRGKWMMSDAVIAYLATLQDDDHRPLWLPTFGSLNTPDNSWSSTLLGWPVISNLEMLSAMPSVAGAGNYPLMFGDFSSYKIRKVGGPRILRLDEVFALRGEIGFIGYQRLDGNYLDAGTHPIALMRLKTS